MAPRLSDTNTILFDTISSNDSEEKSAEGKVVRHEETSQKTSGGDDALRGCKYVRTPPWKH